MLYDKNQELKAGPVIMPHRVHRVQEKPSFLILSHLYFDTNELYENHRRLKYTGCIN